MQDTGASGNENVLIAYFPWGGNTAGIAGKIRRQTGAGLFSWRRTVRQSLTAVAKLASDAVTGEALSVHYSGGATLNEKMPVA